jgi:hypothetical protein
MVDRSPRSECASRSVAHRAATTTWS